MPKLQIRILRRIGKAPGCLLLFYKKGTCLCTKHDNKSSLRAKIRVAERFNRIELPDLSRVRQQGLSIADQSKGCMKFSQPIIWQTDGIFICVIQPCLVFAAKERAGGRKSHHALPASLSVVFSSLKPLSVAIISIWSPGRISPRIRASDSSSSI